MRPIPLDIKPYHFPAARIIEAKFEPTDRTIDPETRFAGLLAEQVLAEWFGVSHSEIHKYDFFFRGSRIEAKCSTQQPDGEPLQHYKGSVGDYYEHDCHYYLFTRIRYTKNDKSYGTIVWVMGYATPSMVINEKNHVEKGDIIDDNNHKVSVPCYKIKYSELFMPEVLSNE